MMLFHGSDVAELYHGDVMAVLPALPDSSVQCVVTSPPYFALRSYLPKGDPLKVHEIGSEPTPEAFIQTMVAVFREVRRVLRDDGTCFVNLGDCYATGGGKCKNPGGDARVGEDGYLPLESTPANRLVKGIDGQLLNIPHRVAEALRADGWIWRQTIVWSKRCLSGGTWLYARTAKGEAPAMLKDLVRLDPSTVKLWDGVKWVQVLGWSRTPKGDERRHLEVELRSGERIGCTEDHRWPTDRGVVYTNDLRIGDVIKTCTLPEPEAVQPLCLPDEEFGWLAGFYLAEGCQTEKGVNFSVHANETDAAAKIYRLARLVGGTNTFRLRRGKSAVVTVYSKTLKAFLAEYITGDSCYNKRLSRKAWMRGRKFLAALLDGYLEGDGHWDIHKRSWTFGFCNNDGLAVDLRCLSARLGQVCVLRRTFHTCNGKRFAGWRGRIRSRSSHWNAQPIGKVVAIRNSRAREFWDVSVDQEPNLFALASGVLTHNSPMPESVNGWRWVRCKRKAGRTSAD